MKDLTLYRCMNCSYITHSEKIITIHFRLKHDIHGDMDFVAITEQHIGGGLRLISWH